MGRRVAIGVVAVLVGGGGAWSAVPAGSDASQVKTTRLVIEMTGGFAYIPSPKPKPNLLEVAYLNDLEITQKGAPVCTVDQVGHRLRILRGTIIEPKSKQPLTKEFDLDGTVVQFPALDKANIPLAFARDGWGTPVTAGFPANPDTETDWHNLRFVPSILRDEKHVINPDWKKLKAVNGWLVLKGGNVRGTLPSDPAMKRATFEFRANGMTPFTLGMTDKIIYTVDVPGTTIELEFVDRQTQKARSRLEIEPQGNMVRLAVRGLHAQGAGMTLGLTQELADHCGFYSLLKDIPDASTWLRPFYISNQPMANGNPQPSPGFFCVPDWF